MQQNKQKLFFAKNSSKSYPSCPSCLSLSMNNEITIRIAKSEDAPALVEFNQAMALETEGKRLDTQILTSGVEAVFHDERKGFYVVAEESEEKSSAV